MHRADSSQILVQFMAPLVLPQEYGIRPEQNLLPRRRDFPWDCHMLGRVGRICDGVSSGFGECD